MSASQITDVAICNLAIRLVGSGKLIQNITDPSNEAMNCQTFYYLLRDKVLRAFPWPFATKFAQLGLVNQYPTPEWGYAYRVPSDCLAIRRIWSGKRNDDRNSQTPYREGQDSQGKLIYTDMPNQPQSAPNPVLAWDVEYTFQAYNTGLWDPDFCDALSLALAVKLAPALGKGDKMKLVERLEQAYETALAKARASAANEEQPDRRPESEMIRARGGWDEQAWKKFPYVNDPSGYSVL